MLTEDYLGKRMLHIPRVTFGIIVLNGQPFLPYCLRSIYPYAYEIIVVEGACENSAREIATPDGHSIDGTLESLQQFKKEQDPENKIRIVTRDGFWSEKDEQSQAYANLAKGDYLWQVDVDEFYKSGDMEFILNRLLEAPEITCVCVKQITFWGGFDVIADGWYLRRIGGIIPRVFKWAPGYRYLKHRPPTILDTEGRDLRKLTCIPGEELSRKGIFMYHYSLVFPKQVIEKSEYYSKANWAKIPQATQWAQDVFLDLKKPYRVHNVYDYPSWLERFDGIHPSEIERLRNDLRDGNLKIETRRTDDVERLLQSYSYRFGRTFLKIFDPWERRMASVWNRFLFAVKNPRRVFRKIFPIVTKNS